MPAEPTFVGAGQSAAETVEYLHRTFAHGWVHSVFSRYGFSPADDSPFVNAIFDPTAIDTFFGASSEVKDELLTYHRNTNYSVVDTALIHDLYARHYQETVTGRQRLHFRRISRVVDVRPSGDTVALSLEYLPTGERERIDADAMVYATGYRPADPTLVLGSVSALCKRDQEDRLRVGLDHRVEATDSLRCGIYLLGATEHAHGLSSSLLSNAAVRAGWVLESIVRSRRSDVRSR